MLVHLRLVVPAELSTDVRDLLVDDRRTTNVTVQPGASVDPPGDLIEADVAREAADDILASLDDLGLDQVGGICVSEPSATPFAAAIQLEHNAHGEPDDGVIWDVVLQQAESSSRASWSFYAFLVLATALAAVAVLTDAPIIVVGAMVVGPDYGVVAAICAGIALGRPKLAARATVTLLRGFALSIVLVVAVALVARLAGAITPADLLRPRPLTAFIWHPDWWSFVVAILAGTAGALAMTSAKSNALVGVFISVTTVPAAGNLAVALALGVVSEITGSLLQLGINVAGLLIAGVATMMVQKVTLRRHGRAVEKVGSEILH
ncbi:DUF389 domain-containing protein [Enemella evansiae]|uniref:DUF389 domain-containing protein n=1 Tax=Enemella evansiae TaxID=2016499 RepID=A0A255G833_9ACTN|nr:DUF389 domain-containing protein [Enemella evansiae]PFG66115.1 putative hydrophobic protein (TIGR00271 family) [Propionibacteriaceae bacterium ES.041]OYN94924.1 hypothetical protein CGZ96_15790 [Enemella evansiae]OYO00252.1 hypothetical protein CGZ97_19720 [Enemella evansiae]OYO09033.1 hypothetical protein CGZ98_14745 [Enemella evansiae]OYO11701.1 hypothetical protein CGZ94_14900 [Enemella evansiae]